MTKYLCVFLLAACLIVPTAAWADIYDFSYTGAGIAASGTITVTPDGGDEYTITGITGVRNGAAITGLDTSPLADGTALDDLIFFAPPAPTSPATFTPSDGSTNGGISGFAFTTAEGIFQSYTWEGGVYPGTSAPIYPAGQYEYTEGSYPSPFTNVQEITFQVSNAAVPEPGAVSLLFAMLAGVGGLAGVLKKKLT